MNEGVLLAIMLGLFAAVGWGIGDFWAARASKIIGPITTLLYTNLLIAGAFSLIYFAFLQPHIPEDRSGIWFAVAGGVLISLAATLFYKGLKAGPVSIVSPISAAYPLFTTFLAVFAFHAAVTGRQVIWVITIVAGVMAAAGLFNLKKAERRLTSGPILAMSASVMYGLAYACLAQGSARIGWQTTSLIEFFILVFASIALLPLVRGEERAWRSAKKALSNRFVWGNALVATVTLAALNAGLAAEPSSGVIATATSSCYPVLTMVLALRHFQERVTLTQLCGAGVTIVGVVLLSLS